MINGSTAIVLNAHLPFVRQPDYCSFIEERWLFEALSETYLPLLRMFSHLDADHVPWKLTMAFSPTLLTMFSDELIQSRYIAWLNKQIELGKKEQERTQHATEMHNLAVMYTELYERALDDFAVLYGKNIISAFDYYYKKGRLELMVGAATGAFLPLYKQYQSAINAQVEAAIQVFRSVFSMIPNGFWVPHLGWYPELDKVLSSYSFDYTIVTARSGLTGKPPARFTTYIPGKTKHGLITFFRDIEATDSVWSEKTGYPSDYVYRDFYKDIGFDLPLDYIEPFIDTNQVRTFTGFKYYAITGQDDGEKQIYVPEKAKAKVIEHAENFLYNQNRKLRKASEILQKPALIVAPFDAELFGHWWFEGIDWLEALFRSAQTTTELGFVNLNDVIKKKPETQECNPEYASWSAEGYAEPWLNKTNDWIYRHVYKLIERMVELSERFPDEHALRERVLNQAAREVLLAMAADWPFLMYTGKSASFARKQIEDAVMNFSHIYEMICANTVGTEWVTRLERKNNIFPEINYRIFQRKR